MDYQFNSVSPPSSTSSSDLRRHSDNSSLHPQNCHSPNPKHSWWESITKAQSHIQLILSLLPSSAANENALSSLADTDHPARSFLFSAAAYSSLSAALSSPTSGARDDPLCNWLYDTYQSGDHDLRLVVLSYLPLISSVYLHRIHHCPTDDLISLSGFEAVLLAIYSSVTRARNGRPITISIPDLSQSSLYHSPSNPIKPSSNSNNLVGVLSPSLEPQTAVKSTTRAIIIGVALDCYYKQITQMPSWSKVDFCNFVTVWAGQNCPCTSEFNYFENSDSHKNGFSNGENAAESVKNLSIEEKNSAEMGGNDLRVPLPWGLLQPLLRTLGHCLLGPLNIDEVKNAASIAVGYLYARANHDLVPQAILATRSLIQLDRSRRAREAASSITYAGGRGTRDRVPLPWSSRLAVARGVARAMEHLHLNTRSQTAVPHGNLKSSNVFVDGNDEILVCDYGLTSLIALPIAAQRMAAYKCPEYQSQKKISKKSDVWSYGCLVLELLTGRIPAHSAPPGTKGVDLCSWVHRAVREEWTAEIFDPEIAVQRGANRGMLRLMQIGIKCCDKSPEKRPEISQVLAEVEEIKCGESDDEEYPYSSFERSLTDESLSVTTSL